MDKYSTSNTIFLAIPLLHANNERKGIGDEEATREDDDFHRSGGIRKWIQNNGKVRHQAYINVPDLDQPGRRFQRVKTFGKR